MQNRGYNGLSRHTDNHGIHISAYYTEKYIPAEGADKKEELPKNL